jgi:GTP1/Obg family GTP-binding protein
VNRDNIKNLRPDILGIDKDSHTTTIERFQSEVLRPIAKYQNTLILKLFRAYLAKYKLSLTGKSNKDQEDIIVQAMKTNKELKSFYQGLMAALMTEDEFAQYIQNRSEINKRITALLTQRILSQILP